MKIQSMRVGMLVVSTVAACLGVAAPAGATADRITQGQATAVFEARGNGGAAIQVRGSGRNVGAPANADMKVAIRPYNSGLHYCAEDWHVLALAYFYGDLSHQEVVDLANAVESTFYLDGQLLQTTRTAVKPFLNPEFIQAETAFFFHQGAILSPSDLAPGSHVVAVTSDSPVFPDDNFVIEGQFYIDGAGTGACL